jgi:hypothetical protein
MYYLVVEAAWKELVARAIFWTECDIMSNIAEPPL